MVYPVRFVYLQNVVVSEKILLSSWSFFIYYSCVSDVKVFDHIPDWQKNNYISHIYGIDSTVYGMLLLQ